jgi:hypothetical protein
VYVRAKPVKQGFPNSVAGGAQAFGILEVQLTAAPLATDNSQAARLVIVARRVLWCFAHRDSGASYSEKW